MVLIFSNISTSRLQYICSFIFNELMGVPFEITKDEERFNQYSSIKINYSTVYRNSAFQISPVSLLFENEIKPQTIECFEISGLKAFFKTSSPDFSFDIFAATFYLLSRYEEYLPHAKDIYGRYAHENSIAFKENFLHLPLINFWVNDLKEKIQLNYQSFFENEQAEKFQISNFKFLPTYDIDIAFSYKHKGLLRNIGGFVRKPSIERLQVLTGLSQDPFDVYDLLNDLHQQHQLQPCYFFLVAEKTGQYDKNILPSSPALQKLIASHANKYPIGLHPSWQSGDDKKFLNSEKNILEEISLRTISSSRQHYIRFNLPEGYQQLIDAGIADDYSMGYGSINGFRASVAASFYWYDLKKESVSSLRVHPFCFMDANSFYEQHFTAAQALDELTQYYQVCKKANGTLITIWHNNFLGTDKMFEGWREVYKKFITTNF